MILSSVPAIPGLDPGAIVETSVAPPFQRRGRVGDAELRTPPPLP